MYISDHAIYSWLSLGVMRYLNKLIYRRILLKIYGKTDKTSSILNSSNSIILIGRLQLDVHFLKGDLPLLMHLVNCSSKPKQIVKKQECWQGS